MAGIDNDKQLIEAFLRGDSGAIEQILGYINKAFYRFIDSLSLDELKDIRSDTIEEFRKALNSESFRGDSAVSSYVTRITCTNAIDEIRRKKRQARILREAELADLPVPKAFLRPDQECDWNEFVRFLFRGVRKLPLECVRLLRMRVRDGISYDDIAVKLKKKSARLRGRMSECRAEFKGILVKFGIIDKQL